MKTYVDAFYAKCNHVLSELKKKKAKILAMDRRARCNLFYTIYSHLCQLFYTYVTAKDFDSAYTRQVIEIFRKFIFDFANEFQIDTICFENIYKTLDELFREGLEKLLKVVETSR